MSNGFGEPGDGDVRSSSPASRPRPVPARLVPTAAPADAIATKARTSGRTARRGTWTYLRGIGPALRDRATYDLRSNVGLWVGFVLGLPIPLVILALAPPLWISVLACAAPFAAAIAFGAARRVALLDQATIGRMSRAAASERNDRGRERAGFRTQALLDLEERHRLESLQRAGEADLALARTIQATLVPSGIEQQDLTVAVRHLPCAYVGGDYLHASLPRPGLLYLCVGDVSGHGVAAALVVSRLHATIQRLVLEKARVARFLETLDRETVRLVQQTSYFMTFAVFRIDLATREIEFATAGHPPQFLLRAGGGLEPLSTSNGPLGMDLLGSLREVRTLKFHPGDTLVLFTDGIFEVIERGGEDLLGEEGLAALIGPLGSRTPDAIATDVLHKVDEYRSLGPFQDDVCLLVARLGRPLSLSTSDSRAAGRRIAREPHSRH